MQAEEYDLSFRLLRAGSQIRRFNDLPVIRLKTPEAHICQRVTQLDVRNNSYLVANYIPAPHSFSLAADWKARYWLMALARDEDAAASGTAMAGSHKAAFA